MNDGIKLSKNTPLLNPLIPCTIVTLLSVGDVEEKIYYFPMTLNYKVTCERL